MEKIRDILTKRINFISRHVPSTIFNQLASEFEEFVYESQALASIVQKLKGKELKLKKWTGQEIFPEAVQREKFAQIEKLYLDIIDAMDLAENKETNSVSNMIETKFDAEKSILIIKGGEIKIKKFSDTYHALKLMFTDSGRDWFFTEFEVDLDQYKIFDEKKFSNAFGYLNKRISADLSIKNFFITGRHSVKINPEFLT